MSRYGIRRGSSHTKRIAKAGRTGTRSQSILKPSEQIQFVSLKGKPENERKIPTKLVTAEMTTDTAEIGDAIVDSPKYTEKSRCYVTVTGRVCRAVS